MITGGIDMGLEYIKAVVLKDNEVIGKACGHSGGAMRAEHAKAVWEAALANAKIDADDIFKIIATGKGKYDVPFAETVYTEPTCLLAAASILDPDATMVFSIGADESLIITIKDSKVNEMTLNQKCSAGFGIMMEVIADRLGVSMEELANIPLIKAANVAVADGCMVFAEMDALSLLNQGTDIETVIAAVVKSAAARAAVVFDDVTYPNTDKIVLVGGVAKLPSFVQELEKLSGAHFIVAIDPDYYLAVGAAVKAAQE